MANATVHQSEEGIKVDVYLSTDEAVQLADEEDVQSINAEASAHDAVEVRIHVKTD